MPISRVGSFTKQLLHHFSAINAHMISNVTQHCAQQTYP